MKPETGTALDAASRSDPLLQELENEGIVLEIKHAVIDVHRERRGELGLDDWEPDPFEHKWR